MISVSGVVKVTELTVVLPTFNEAENLPLLIRRIEKLGLDCEIIVVDDNSSDGTAEAARELMSRFANIRLIERPSKSGIDTAVRDAARAARGRYIAVMDSDLQHPPELLPQLLNEARKGKELVIASRYAENSKTGMGFLRRLVSKCATMLAHFFVPKTRSVSDPLSGYFIFKKDSVDPGTIGVNSYKVLLEIIARNPVRAAEIPFDFGERHSGRSKLGFSEMVRFIALLFRYSDYRLAKFMIVGAIGIGINESLLYLLEPHAPLLLASAVAVEASIVSNFIMNNAWTFRNKIRCGFLRGLLKYNFVTTAGALLNIAILGILVLIHFEYLAANFVGTIFGFAANYIGSEGFVWRLRLPVR
jgi:dolichol-phosphate mannosyltransferase